MCLIPTGGKTNTLPTGTRFDGRNIANAMDLRELPLVSSWQTIELTDFMLRHRELNGYDRNSALHVYKGIQ